MCKKLCKLYTNPTFDPALRWFSVSCEMYSLRLKLYTNYTLNLTQNPTQRAFKTLHSERSEPYTASVRKTIHEAERKPYILSYEHELFTNWTELMGQLMRQSMRQLMYNLMSKFEKPFPLGRGWGRLPLQKSNNFEPFFSDLTLTFLTYRNTFCLPILLIRRIIFLCLPLI